jgi:cobalt-precorrin 5A hydrolase
MGGSGSLIVGLGARRGTSAGELTGAIVVALAEAGLPLREVAVLATLDRRAEEEAVRSVAAAHGWQLVSFEAAALADRAVPTGSEIVAAAVGTGSVAEAAALAGAEALAGVALTGAEFTGAALAGDAADATLVVRKRVFDGVTVAVARAVVAADAHPRPALGT